MRILAASLFLIVVPHCAGAQALSIGKVKIVNVGIYELEIRKKSERESLAERSWEVVRKIRQVQATTKIPARTCISFGFEYTIAGTPVGTEVPIKMITKFPSQGLFNPQNRKTTYQNEMLITRTIGNVHLRSYTFDKEWELIPGVWTFQLWYKDQKLAEQSFTVVVPCVQGCDQPAIPKSECEENQVSVAPTAPATKLARPSGRASGRDFQFWGKPSDVF